jgi:hypothetical protein
MYAINTEIQAQDIQPGMVIDIYGAERIAVERVAVKWGAVQIRDHAEWRGLGLDERVTVRGYFNV